MKNICINRSRHHQHHWLTSSFNISSRSFSFSWRSLRSSSSLFLILSSSCLFLDSSFLLFSSSSLHSRYWSIKWYGGRGRFDINQGLAAASIVPPVVCSLPWWFKYLRYPQCQHQRKLSKHVKYLNCQIAKINQFQKAKPIQQTCQPCQICPLLKNIPSFNLLFNVFVDTIPLRRVSDKENNVVVVDCSDDCNQCLENPHLEQLLTAWSPTPGTTFNNMITNTWNNF